MPALPDDMYCSEQICIPPSFPYLLRQFAKAAIRTQPTDILKWSTAYFRCLSLNIPPPVKPRLEYPIPRDFNGITPGWLKALLYQLQNNLTIPFKILWDRWIGACLQHHTLIQLLCLGGFEDAQTIPWLKFTAVCASTLTDDLTHTMILICEILTEEPEGGSAMIPLETFVELYTFLAKIDASHDQTLRNYFFRDSLLSLWRDKVEKEEVKDEVKEDTVLEIEESVKTKTSSETLEEEKLEDIDKIVSCPSLPEDDHYSIDYLLKQQPYIEEEGLEEGDQLVEEAHELEMSSDKDDEATREKSGENEVDEERDEHEIKQGEEDEDAERDAQKEETEETELTQEDMEPKVEEEGEVDVKEGEPTTEAVAEVKDDHKEGEPEQPQTEEEVEPPVVKEYESVDTITDQPVRNLEHIFEDDALLREDLERLRALQQELAGETDEELEKFKCRLIEEMPLTQSQEEGVKHFKIDKIDHPSSEEKLKEISGENLKSDEGSSESQDAEEDKRAYDEICVGTIPGIGEIVPEHQITTVVEYMKNCAKIQHGMVMPRNIRHYSCPPLEVLKY